MTQGWWEDPHPSRQATPLNPGLGPVLPHASCSGAFTLCHPPAISQQKRSPGHHAPSLCAAPALRSLPSSQAGGVSFRGLPLPCPWLSFSPPKGALPPVRGRGGSACKGLRMPGGPVTANPFTSLLNRGPVSLARGVAHPPGQLSAHRLCLYPKPAPRWGTDVQARPCRPHHCPRHPSAAFRFLCAAVSAALGVSQRPGSGLLSPGANDLLTH